MFGILYLFSTTTVGDTFTLSLGKEKRQFPFSISWNVFKFLLSLLTAKNSLIRPLDFSAALQ
uniref:Uncharacterized protein n=1 Tax=Rhizophora mucronata TaxID=61149 RepID=A0A2P2PRY1_RHIMU